MDIRPERVDRYAAMDGRTNPDGSAYHLTAEQVLQKLPDIVDFCRVYLGVDPLTQLMPVAPTAHYTMGGIPTTKFGEVILDRNNTVMPGLFAVGECACVSVHGANRLGTNSLLDLVVFGKAGGESAVEEIRRQPLAHRDLPKGAGDFSLARLARLDSAASGERGFDVGHA